MACKERSEHECKSYPKCEGCNAHTNNLTFKHRVGHRSYKDGEWDTVAKCDNRYTYITELDGSQYFEGPVVDRLHEFEKLGYEPEELKKIINLFRVYRQAAHSTYGMTATKKNDAVDTLYYMAKLAGDVENAQCKDIRSMYPSMMFTKEGFRELYATNETFKKMMDERIRDAILRPVTKQKVWVTTSSSVKDDEFVKKVKEAVESLSGDKESTIKTFYAPENWEIHHPLIWKHHPDIAFGKVTNIEKSKEGTKVTITKNPEYQFKIKRVLFNNPATIVFWADGDKTVVKCQNNEPYDPEKGLAMAISKKALGNDRGYYEEFQKQLGRGQKHSTPEQFNSEVCHIQKLEDLKAAEEDNKTNRALAADALDYLKTAFINPKSTKTDLMHGMAKAIECVNAILDNY